MSTATPSVRRVQPFESLVPAELMPLSGGVFYSGRDAFTGSSPIYLLGLNPGGDPATPGAHTVEQHLHATASNPTNHSAYRDESWEKGRPRGTWGMQPRVLHLCARLGLDPGEVPASNPVFVRSSREATMQPRLMDRYADLCWPFHAAVIETLAVQVVVCFGTTTGAKVRARLGAGHEIARFKETNNRGWTSYAHAALSGVRVVTASHPSIADWTNPATDVSDLVSAALTVGEIGEPLLFGAAELTDVSDTPNVERVSRATSHAPVCMNEDCAQIYQPHPGECW